MPTVAVPPLPEAVADALAVARLTRLLQHDEVWPVREARDAYRRAAGNTRWADLADCPWCLSVWLAAAVLGARIALPRAWPLIARGLAASELAGHLTSD
jgi:hypothetical protein